MPDAATPGRTLLVGGGGFIGRNLLDALRRAGAPVRCLELKKAAWMDDSLDLVEGDFTVPQVVDRAMEGCDAVVHLASTVLPQSSNESPEYDISTNLVGGVRLIQCAVKRKVRKLLFISSGGTVYGKTDGRPIKETHPCNPLCSYGIVKLAVEKYLALADRLYGLDYCSVRLSNPYGRYQRGDVSQGAIAVFCHRALHGLPIEIWGDGSVSRDFIYIDDVVAALLKALGSTAKLGELNVGTGHAASVNDIVSLIRAQAGKALNVTYKPARDFDVPKSCLDVSKAERLLGWKPGTALQDGIRETLRWQAAEMAKAGGACGPEA